MVRGPSQEELLASLQSSLTTIQKLKNRLATHEEPIAVIGLGCRLPGGVNTPDDFWRLLVNGVDAVGEAPRSRWDVDAYYDPNPEAPDKMYTRWGGFLENVDTFDPQFFGISPREAVSMDPQQRLLLEVAWEALENAGQVWDRLQSNPVGVFVGISGNDYVELIKEHGDASGALEGYYITGNALNAAAGRLSYILGLQGPSMAIDTACSSSLVAVHLACQSLRQGECRMALACGVNLILTPQAYVALSRIHALSPDGRCKSFDARADGYGRGEGCGVVVLKRLADAQADGDPIWAVIRGSAVNQDGPSSGLTVPNGPAQQALIRQALANAKVTPAEVGYVEAHGTGTPLGDPIEVEALGAVFAKRQQPLLIGSVKSNLGHLEAAAGVTALIKTVLSLHHAYIPPTLHLQEPNPRIPWNTLPLQASTSGTPWPTSPRIAGVSSFGFSGTNAHLVVEAGQGDKETRRQGEGECGELETGRLETRGLETGRLRDGEIGEKSKIQNLKSEISSRPLHLLTLSAKNEAALREAAARMGIYLGTHATNLADVAAVANTRRVHFRHRLAVIAADSQEAQEKLAAFAAGQSVASLHAGELGRNQAPKIAFLFTGQGAQYVDMGRELYETQPLFHQTLNRCDEILHPLLGESLLQALYPDRDTRRQGDKEAGRSGELQGAAQSKIQNPKSKIDETAFTQPALFALEYALAQLWISWGITPGAVMGHSVGEYVAACVAGVFSLEDGLTLIAERARLMQALPQDGMMAAVFTGEEQVATLLPPYAAEVSIAAVNGPHNVVVSGATQSVRALLAQLNTRGITNRPLKVSHAFHSPLMTPMLDAFTQRAAKVTMQAPRLPFVSNLTGDFLAAGEIPDAAYWRRHTRAGVRFAASVETLWQNGYDYFLEIGPKPILTGLGRQISDQGHWLPSLQSGQSDWSSLLNSLATLYLQGVKVAWAGFDVEYCQRQATQQNAAWVTLPTYPFQRKRYWIHEKESPMTVQTPTVVEAPTIQPEPQRQEQIQQELATLMASAFQVDPTEIGLDVPFLEMGADSIVLLNAVRTIEGIYGVKISMRQFFEELSTLGSLASYLDHHLPPTWGQTTVATAESQQTIAAQPVSYTNGHAANGHTTHGHTTNGHTGANGYTAAPGIVSPSTLLPQPALSSAPLLPPALNPPVFTGQNLTTPEQSQTTNAVERIMRDQLAVMIQQLQVLGTGRSQNALESPVPTVTPPASATSAPTTSGNGHHIVYPPGPSTAAPAQPATPKAKEVALPAAFAPWKKAQTQAPQLEPRQQKHLDELIARYTARTQRSKALTQKYRQALADNRASAGFRPSIKEMLYPLMGDRGEGSHFWDVDGNEYIDITMGFGALLHGHAPEFVNAAVAAQLQQGVGIGPQTELAGEVAQLICELTGMERVTFCNTGTEAIMTALRIARARTGRPKIAYFIGSYHGHNDITLGMPEGGNEKPNAISIFPGVAENTVADTLVVEYGNSQSLAVIRAHAHELAAVLVEPVQSRRPDLQPREFLQQLRQLTRETGVALIFDETITGFRVHPGGAQAWFGVEADLATYGKVAGGGLPLGLVAGRAAFMDAIDGGFWCYGDTSHPQTETTFFAGTFSKHPLTMAATRAALLHLHQQGPTLQEALNQRTAYLANTLNAYFAAEEVPIQIVYFGSLFRFVFKSNMDLFFYHLLDKGIFVWEGRNCFLSTAHSDADLARIIQAVQETVVELRSGGFLPDLPPGARRTPNTPVAPPPFAQSAGTAAKSSNGTHPTATHLARPLPPRQAQPPATVDFSLYYFGHYEAEYRPDKYDLLIESARFADQHGFAALWMPERHFHPFGGISPNPSILCAALARETSQIQLRAGSVVLPLHHPIRVVEDWAMIDNLSQGRVGISFASGWHPNDFVFAPEAFGRHRDQMFEFIDTVQKLWRGEPMSFRNGAGGDFTPRLHPQPKQRNLSTWVTIVKNPDTYQRAGAMGAHVLTNLMGQTTAELAENITRYRQARAEHGHDPATGRVTVLLHTFIGEDLAQVREQARRPFYNYLNSSMGLFKSMVQSMGLPIDLDSISADDKEFFLSMVYERYVQESALIGTLESSTAVIDKLLAIGVNEIACFVDFGVDAPSVLAGLPHINALRAHYQEQTPTDLSGFRNLTGLEPQRIPMTSAQQQVWVLAQLDAAGAIAYNDFVAIELRGPLQQARLQQALQQVVDRHEALRTTVDKMGDVQLVWPAGSSVGVIDLPLIDFSATPAADRAAQVQAWFQGEGQTPLNLAEGPILSVHLLKLEAQTHLLALRAHHTIIDGWSWAVIFQELGAFYTELTSGKTTSLPAAPMQFRDYVAWQSAQKTTPAMTDHEAYWLQQFAGPLPVLDLPTDRPQPPARSYQGSRATRQLSADLTVQLKEVSRKQGCTLFMTLFSGFSALLHRLAGQDDLVIGTPVAGRFPTGSETLIGYCTHLLPIRSRLAADTSFLAYLKQMRGTLLTAYEHQHYPFAWLLDKLTAQAPGTNGELVEPQQGTNRTPLVTVTFNLDQPLALPKLGELQSSLYAPPLSSSIFDITLNVIEVQNGLLLYCDYNTDLFDAATIERYLGHYETLLAAAVNNLQAAVTQLPLLTAAERQQILVEWNATEAPYPEKCIHQLFEEQVERTPDAVAVIFEEESARQGDNETTRQREAETPLATFTYHQLNRRANQLAQHLSSLGVTRGNLVGVCLERSGALLPALLGILKAGGAYVPLDPAYPSDRLAYMLADSQAQVLLTQRSLADRLPTAELQVIYVDEVDATTDLTGFENLSGLESLTPDDLLYVVYTSGSTGHPKGAQGAHRGAVNRFQWMWNTFPFAADEVCCQKTALSFVDSVWECFGPLLRGIPIVMIPDAIVKNPQRLVQRLAEQQVTRLVLVPSLLRALLDTYPGLQTRLPKLTFWVCSGEALSTDLCQRFYAQMPESKLLNLYGSSEVAGDVTWYDTSVASAAHRALTGVPIGRPMSNTQIYILDQHGQPTPIGVPGEVYAGGANIGRGYHNRPELTQERFLPNPFLPGGRLYRMGDRARYLPDGVIEYLGRKDFQVKIRGFRVELGEVETLLADHPAVREVVVTARPEQDGGYQLTAYIVPQRMPLAVETLRAYAAEKLPEYMRPAAYLALDAFPLTPSGKVDRRALPDPDLTQERSQAKPYLAPRTATEEALVAIWAEVLARPGAQIGVEDDFFTIGGHSLRAVQVVNRVQEAFTIELALDTLFEKQTIAQLAEIIELEQLTQAEGVELARLLAEMEEDDKVTG